MERIAKLVIGCVGSVGIAMSTHAQTTAAPGVATAAPEVGLQEIIVTAERRESSLQKTPASIAVVSGSDINEQGLNTIDDALKNIPGVTIQGQAKGFTPAIRGLGSDLPPGSGEGAVATDFDGIYNIRAEAGLAGYYDLSRIEVLRGPQGTLYGRNATGGVVNVISNDPVLGVTSGYGTLEVGDYGLLRGEGMVNVPITDDFAVRGAFSSINRNGYLTTGQDDDVAQAGRLKLLYKPSDTLSVLIGSEFTKLGGKGPGSVPAYANGNAPSNPWYSPPTITSGGETFDATQDANRYQSYKVWSQVDWNLGFGVLTFLPSYQHASDSEYGCDHGSCYGDSGDPANLEQISGEMRLASTPSSTVKWVAGVYHYNDENRVVTPDFIPLETIYNLFKAESNAVFAQVTVPVYERLRLTGGVRETYDWKNTDVVTSSTEIGSSAGTGTDHWYHFDWKAGLEYDLTSESMLYTTASTGNRPGGFNTEQPVDGKLVSFNPETLKSYEVGSKNRFLNDRLQVNGDIYYYDYRNYQAFDFLENPFPVFDFFNVNKVKDYGAEMDAQVLLTKTDRLSFSAAYLEAAYDSSAFIHTGGVYTGPGTNLDGAPLPHSPKWSLNSELQHIFRLSSGADLTGHVNVRYVTGQYVGPDEQPLSYQPSYVKEDASLVYDSSKGDLTITAYGKNLSNVAVKNFYVNNWNQLAAPRTYGFVVTKSF